MEKQNTYLPSIVFHPGETLEEKLEEMGMGSKEFAVRANKPEKTIIAILKGESSITADMAVQFESVTKIPAHFWINHQRSYDEFIAREKHKAVIEQAIPWAKSFPLSTMIKKGWLPEVATIQEKTAAMLSFFGLSSHVAWENYYFNQQLKVDFRISLASTNQPYAISGWLRKGELQATELEAKPYVEKNFKEALPALKAVMAQHPDNFFHQLQSICLEAGVKVVHTPCLPQAPINGATRWLNDTPLIQLTGRYNRNDSFWFTFFHEAGHILLHGKKDIFLEKVDYSDKDLVKEKQADEFAIKWTLTETEEKTIWAAEPLNEYKINYFAKQFNTHPAIIVGRFQHKGLMRPSSFKQYMEPVVFD